MRKFILAIISLIALTSAQAVDMSPCTRLYLDRLMHSRPGLHRAQADEEEPEHPAYIPMLLQISDESVVDDLESLGTIVYSRRLDIVAVSIPYDNIQAVFALPGVLYASRGGDLSSNLDKARSFGRVDEALSGVDGLTGYDGSGVVVGITDIGFDHTHPAFRSRVSQLHHVDEYNGTSRSALTREEISRWVTDDSTQFHATHVAGILAGSAGVNQYDGVARGSDLVITTSTITDVGILYGIEKIIEYAKSQGKPAAINVSISNHVGAHDGRDLFARYISECARDAVICFSAGNSGKRKIYASHDFTSAEPVARVILNSLHSWNGFDISGMADIWCDTDAQLEFAIGIYDMSNGDTLYATPWTSGDKISGFVGDNNDSEWGRYLTGTIAFDGGVSPLNGRYNIGVSFDYTTHEYVKDRRYARYYAELMVRGPEGSHIDLFTDGKFSYFDPVYRSTTVVGADGSINAMSVADGVISVGAFSTRNSVPAFPEGTYVWNFDENCAAGFSSYSVAPTIGQFPHFCAPGNMVVSSMSSSYMELHPEELRTASVTVDGKEYFWAPECGTSMASPFSAGVIALWLQADPTLTSKEIIEIAQRTARRDFDNPGDPRVGAGAIDALAGLKYITEHSVVEDIATDARPIIRVTPDRRIEAIGTTIMGIYTPSGQRLSADQPLHPGIYIIHTGDGVVKVFTK